VHPATTNRMSVASEHRPALGNQYPESGKLLRLISFLGVCGAAIVLLRAPIETLASLALHDDRYTFIVTIPFISLGLIWLRRLAIFADARSCPRKGLAVLFFGLTLFYVTGFLPHLKPEYVLSIRVTAVLTVCLGAFVWFYGTRAARAAVFPLTFLLLMIPIPVSLLAHVVVSLQEGSAETAYRLFKFTGMPVFREDAFKFSLPGVTIEVADECSGIRSSLSMFIGSIVTGYLILRSGWSRAFFALLTIPVVIFKNAVRIVTLSWLGVYVDPGFLHGRLHRYSGLPFSLLALALLAPVLLLLMKNERRDETDA
jgi:exosortase